jgi:methionyl-tRNA formyltransferase
MDAGLDTGPILMAQSVPIRDDDTAGSLHDRLASLGAKLIVQALARLDAGSLAETPQPGEGASYARKIGKAEAKLDWRDSAQALDRKVRAFNPAPGAGAMLGGVDLKIWRARPVTTPHGHQPGCKPPGEILAVETDGIRVACGEGELILSELQKPGGKRLAAEAFLRGFAIKPGDRFLAS